MRPDGLKVRTTDNREFVWFGGLDRLEQEHPGSVVLHYEDRRPYEGRQPGEPKPEPVNPSNSRAELNTRAASLGIPEPDKLPNKDAVLAAIEAKQAEINPPSSNEGPPDGVVNGAPQTDDEPDGTDAGAAAENPMVEGDVANEGEPDESA